MPCQPVPTTAPSRPRPQVRQVLLAPKPAPQARRGGSTIAKADIPVGGGKIFADLQAVVTQPKSGDFKAFTSVCTHQGCTVAEVVQTINCNCHGSKFSITDGSVVNGPATAPLAAKRVTANGNSLTVS